MPDLVEIAEEVLHECSECGTEWDYEFDAEECCSHSCTSCGANYGHGMYAEEQAYECCRELCPTCGAGYDNYTEAEECCGSTTFRGSVPVLADVDPYRVSVPAIANRPGRLCSLEQELADGGGMVAAMLYNVGLANDSTVHGYHFGGNPATVHVEEDGSLPSAGGEVIYSRFDLSNERDIGNLSMGLTKIRQLRDLPDRPVKTSYSAGVHVHVAARDNEGGTFGPRDVAALYELWCYAEDMLYAFSAAGWQRHRQPSDDYSSGYARKVPKSQHASPRGVWNLMGSDRYFGLNFQRLFQAVNRCSCGAARMGDWQSCDCGAFDGATIEWRVFNSSTLPRTIHAWLLMAHAMTAHAAKHELGTLPVNEYGSTSREDKREVLDHLLGVLPLLEEEKAVIREAADRSPGL